MLSPRCSQCAYARAQFVLETMPSREHCRVAGTGVLSSKSELGTDRSPVCSARTPGKESDGAEVEALVKVVPAADSAASVPVGLWPT